MAYSVRSVALRPSFSESLPLSVEEIPNSFIKFELIITLK